MVRIDDRIVPILESSPVEQQGPVECLGMTFENDEKRRDYFLEKLRKKLKEPEFRKLEGFPIGEDKDILALSDPPYYTSCPNPFIDEFIEHYGKSYDPNDGYDKEPFAADITEGRHTWLYKAHTYHTKVPPKAIQKFVEHYTDPGDVVLDGFAGSGMTAVAALLADQTRSTLTCDLSPAASFIAATYLAEIEPQTFLHEANRIAEQLDNELGWMYHHFDGLSTRSICNYFVWSDVFICNSCGSEIVFWDAAFNKEDRHFRKTFQCQACGAENSKGS